MSSTTYTDSWYLMYSSFPDLNWARLRTFSSGASEVSDCDEKTHHFVSRENALNWLLEDEFVAYEKLGAEDEAEYGITISEIAPPELESVDNIKTKMYLKAN